MVAPRNKIGDVVKEKFVMLFHRLVLFARNSGGKFGKIAKEKFVMLFHRFVLFARNSGSKFSKIAKEKFVMLLDRFVVYAQNVGRDREDDNKAKLDPKIAWPHVMNSSLAMRGSLASGTWIWHRQHAHWHHGYYRTRR
jgi:hypothetical protein